MASLEGSSLRLHGANVALARATLMWRIVAVLVLGALLAHWVWVICAPRSASVRPAVQSASGAKAEALFGVAAVSSVAGVQSVLPSVRLVGVFAGTPGFAVMELDGRHQVGLATGGEIAAGARLVEVASDHVVIERDGVRQQILLEGKTTALRNAVNASVQPDAVKPGEAMHR